MRNFNEFINERNMTTVFDLKDGDEIIDPTTNEVKTIERIDLQRGYVNMWYTDGVMKRYQNQSPSAAMFDKIK